MMRSYQSVAALIAGIVLITFFGLRMIISSNGNGTLNSYELSEIVDYYMVDYDDELIYNTILDSETEIDIQPLKEYSEEIMEYLEDEGIDYSLLIVQYPKPIRAIS